MSAEKSIVDAGYTVTPAENGGVIVEGRGINAGVCHAFSNAREYLEFLCRQYKGVDPLDCCGPHREKIEAKKAEQRLTDDPPAKMPKGEFLAASLKASLGSEGPKPAFELIHAESNQVWRIYEDGRTEGFPEGGFIINRIPILAHIAHAEGYNAGMKWNTE